MERDKGLGTRDEGTRKQKARQRDSKTASQRGGESASQQVSQAVRQGTREQGSEKPLKTRTFEVFCDV